MSRLSLKNDFKDGEVLYGGQLNANNKATMAAVNDNYEKIQGLQSLKADVSDVTEKLAGKVDVDTFNDEINSLNTTKANVSLVNTKADKTEVALKADQTYVDSQLANKAEKSYVDSQISQNVGNLSASLENKADKTYVDTSLDTKVNKSNYILDMDAKADKTTVGNLSDLKTTDKSSIVGAINSTQTKTIPIATTSVAGIVKPDGTTVKVKPDGTISSVGEEVYIGETEPTNENVKIWLDPSGEASVDTVMSDTSTNPVQNRVIKDYVDSHSGGGGGVSYTAGEGINITDNVISSTVQVPTNISAFNNDSGYLTDVPAETDPVFITSPASKITDEDINNWNNAGGGATYTAGNNIEITEDNVINVSGKLAMAVTPAERGGTIVQPDILASRVDSVAIGSNAKITDIQGTAIGGQSSSSYYGFAGGYKAKAPFNGVAIGAMSGTSRNIYRTVALGVNAMTNFNDSIAIGYSAIATKEKQLIIGSGSMPIDEMAVYTSSGVKYIATTDLIDALTTRISELETRIATLEGNV